MTTADRIFEYLGKWCPVTDPDPAKLRRWFNWYWHQALVLAVQRQGEIVACALVRRVTSAEQANDALLAHDEHGPLLWVDFATCQAGPAGWRALTDLVAVRFGALPNTCAFHRAGRAERRRPRILSTETFFERLRHGKQVR